jgi:hypothetical protein
MIKTADSEGGDQFQASCAAGERKNDARHTSKAFFFLLACLMLNGNHFWHRFLEASQKHPQKKCTRSLARTVVSLSLQLQALV